MAVLEGAVDSDPVDGGWHAARRRRRLLSIYLRAHAGVFLGSLLGSAALIAAFHYYEVGMLTELVVVSLGSGAIAQAALAVGSLGIWMLPSRTRDAGAEATSAMQANLTCAMTGMLIRLAGTVALFLYCRYQLAASDEVLACLVLGWYAGLTALEVHLLTRDLPSADCATGPAGQSRLLAPSPPAADVAAGTAAPKLRTPKHAG